MNPLVTGLLVGALTTIGRWSRGKGLTIDTVLGVLGVAFGLAIIEQFNKDLAKAFSALVIVAVAWVHLPHILKQTGLEDLGK